MQNMGFWDICQHFSYNQRPICVILGGMTDADKIMHPQHFGTDPTDIQIGIRIWIPDHFCLKCWRWRRFALCECSRYWCCSLTVVLSLGVCLWSQPLPNTHMRGGTANRAQTIADCRWACINTLYCIGIDLDLTPNNPYCWLNILPSSGRMEPFNGVTHYTLTRLAGCPFVGELAFIDCD